MINKQEFEGFLSDMQIYHSEFQMDHFITTKAGGTLYGMYCQALRELHGRYEGLKEATVDIKIKTEEAKEYEEKARKYLTTTAAGDSTSARYNILKLKALRNRMVVEGMERSLKHRIREFIHFYYQAKALKDKLGDLGPTKRKRLEHLTWLYRLRLHAYIDIVSNGRVSNTVFENILSLKEADRKELIEMVEVPEKLIQYFDRCKIDLPDYKADHDEIETIRRMIDVKP